MTNSAAAATGDEVAFTMAIVRAPVARADFVAATRSGLRPDCEITMNRAFRSTSGVRNAVVTDGALAETGRPSRVSTRYLRKTPAWPELPRPHRTHKGADSILSHFAIPAMSRRLRTIRETTSALSPISLAIAEFVTAQRLHLDCAPPSLSCRKLSLESSANTRRRLPSYLLRIVSASALSEPKAKRTAVLISPSA